MTPERLVWVVTDQSRNHRALIAWLEHIAREFATSVGVRHVPQLTKYDIVRTKVPTVQAFVRKEQERWAQARSWDPILVFRDAECRAERELIAARDHVTAVVDGLQRTFPNTWGLAFNPMSEGAFLLFDEAVAALQASTKDEATLRRLVAQKRAGQLVNKDVLEETLAIAPPPKKRALDEHMASLFAGPIACDHPQYTSALEQIRRVLRAGLLPDQGTNGEGGSAPE